MSDDEPAARTCSRCGREQPIGEYYLFQSGRSAGRRESWCRTCARAANARYRAKPEFVRKQKLRRDAAAAAFARLREEYETEYQKLIEEVRAEDGLPSRAWQPRRV